MGKGMRHTLGASLNIRHNLSSSKGPKPLQLTLLTTYIPKTSAFTLAFSTSQRLRTTRASARTFFTFRHYITPSALQISISSLQTHNVNRCGRSRHLARKLSLRRKRSSPNVFEMAATETITSIILIKLIRVSLGTVRHPRRFKIV